MDNTGGKSMTKLIKGIEVNVAENVDVEISDKYRHYTTEIIDVTIKRGTKSVTTYLEADRFKRIDILMPEEEANKHMSANRTNDDIPKDIAAIKVVDFCQHPIIRVYSDPDYVVPPELREIVGFGGKSFIIKDNEFNIETFDSSREMLIALHRIRGIEDRGAEYLRVAKKSAIDGIKYAGSKEEFAYFLLTCHAKLAKRKLKDNELKLAMTEMCLQAFVDYCIYCDKHLDKMPEIYGFVMMAHQQEDSRGKYFYMFEISTLYYMGLPITMLFRGLNPDKTEVICAEAAKMQKNKIPKAKDIPNSIELISNIIQMIIDE